MSVPFSSLASRIVLAIVLLSSTIWLGGTVVRTAVGYGVFVPGTLVYAPEGSDAERLAVIRLFASTAAITGWAFAVAVFFGLVMAVQERRSFRKNGWLLMCVILGVLVAASQGYVIWEDYIFSQHFDFRLAIPVPLLSAKELMEIYLNRMSNIGISMAHILSVLSAATIIIIAAVRPLTRK